MKTSWTEHYRTRADRRRLKDWQRKLVAANRTGARFYGDGGTIHDTSRLDVMVDENGVVKAVWFRCMQLPFEQHEAREWDGDDVPLPKLTGVEIQDV